MLTVEQIIFLVIKMEGFGKGSYKLPWKNVEKVVSVDSRPLRRGSNNLLSWMKAFSAFQSLTHSVENDVCLEGSCAF